ncbi:proline--tRNA ligase [Ostertagia ostertagi]
MPGKGRKYRPTNEEYVKELDDVYEEAGESSEQRMNLLNTLGAYRKPMWLRRRLATLAKDKQDWDTAIGELQQIVRHLPTKIALGAGLALRSEAGAYSYRGNIVIGGDFNFEAFLFQSSVNAYGRVLEIDPSSDYAICVHLRLFFNTLGDERFEHLKKVFNLLDGVIAGRPRVSLAYKLAADALLHAIKFKEELLVKLEIPSSWSISCRLTAVRSAVMFYSVALDLNRENAWAWNDLAIALLCLARIEKSEQHGCKAHECLRKAMSLSKCAQMRSQLWTLIAEAERLSAMAKDATATDTMSVALQQHYLVRALQLNKANDEAWLRLALLYYTNGAMVEAHLTIETALKHNPQLAEAWCAWALKAESEGLGHEAMDMFRHSISIKPVAAAVMKYTAFLCQSLRVKSFDPATVMIDFNKVLRLRGLKAGQDVHNPAKSLEMLAKLCSKTSEELFNLLKEHQPLYRDLFERLVAPEAQGLQELYASFTKSISVPLVVAAILRFELPLCDQAVTVLHDVLPRHELIDVFPTIMPEGMDNGLKYVEQDRRGTCSDMRISIAKMAKELEIEEQIVAQGDLVRQLKGDASASEDVKKEAIEKLLRLKLTYKEITGKDYAAPGGRKQKVVDWIRSQRLSDRCDVVARSLKRRVFLEMDFKDEAARIQVPLIGLPPSFAIDSAKVALWKGEDLNDLIEQCGQESPDARRFRVYRALQSGNATDAAEDAKAILADEPASWRDLVLVAELNLAMSKDATSLLVKEDFNFEAFLFQSSVNAYGRVLEIDPSSDYAICLIQVLMRMHNLEGAAEQCTKWRATGSQNAQLKNAVDILEAQVHLRLFFNTLGDERFEHLKKVFNLLDGVIAGRPRVSLAYKLAADALLHAIKFKEELLVKLEIPSSWSISCRLTAVRSAVMFYSVALDLNRENAWAWNDLAIALLCLARIDKSEQHAAKAHECLRKAMSLSKCAQMRSQLWTLIAEAERLSAMAKDATATDTMSVALQQHYLVRALQLNKANDEAWLRLALLYYTNGAMVEAHLTIETALKHNPQLAEAWCAWALKAESEGLGHEAMDMFRHSISIKPVAAAVMKYTAFLCQSLRVKSFDPATVMIDFNKVLRLRDESDSSDKNLLLHIGVLAELFGHYEDAVQCISDSGYDGPHLQRARMKAGQDVHNPAKSLEMLAKLCSKTSEELFNLLKEHQPLYRDLFERLVAPEAQGLQELYASFTKSISVPLVVAAILRFELPLCDQAVTVLHDVLPRHELIDVFPTIMPEGMDNGLKYVEQDGEEPFRYSHFIAKPLWEILKKRRDELESEAIDGSPSSDVKKEAIEKLLRLKLTYKEITGKDYAAPGGRSKKWASYLLRKPDKKPAPEKKQEKKQERKLRKKQQVGIEVIRENYSEWYGQVITKAEMIEYYDVSGCYVLRPWSYAIWESIQAWFDSGIKKLGVKNCYFPMFVSNAALEREKTHIADFAPEVAWVTPSWFIRIGRTHSYQTYIGDGNRWEFKHPTPFLRTREFLWQEGHTAFANPDDAIQEVFQILDLYAGVYTDLLAIPVVKGRKSEKEKFAGGDFTTTVEAYVPCNGRGIQGATSHHLGQNFSKMFDISFEDPATGGKMYAWQNSWGLSTRTIGAMVMIHADDSGLVLPPRVASIQAIVLPVGITAQTTDEQRKQLIDTADQLAKTLVNADIRAEADLRDNYSPGWKFNHWELKGVPIRLEVGPKDLAANQVTAVLRYNGKKLAIKQDELVSEIKRLLEMIHVEMYNKVLAARDAHMKTCYDFEEFKQLLDEKFILLSPFCGEIACEDEIKKASTREDADAGAAQMGAKTLCIPLEQPKDKLPDQCLFPSCKNKAKFFALFGRSY